MGGRSRARFSLDVAAAAAALVLVALLQLHGGGAVVVAAASEPPYTCGAGAPPNIPFCDTRLPIDRRVDDLVSRMTVAEKISQLGDQSPAIPRLGVPAYQWWSEALHGISNQGRGIHLDGPLTAATSFPQVILTAASFNPHLWYRIGQVRTLLLCVHRLSFSLYLAVVNALAACTTCPPIVFTCPLCCCATTTGERGCFTAQFNQPLVYCPTYW